MKRWIWNLKYITWLINFPSMFLLHHFNLYQAQGYLYSRTSVEILYFVIMNILISLSPHSLHLFPNSHYSITMKLWPELCSPGRNGGWELLFTPTQSTHVFAGIFFEFCMNFWVKLLILAPWILNSIYINLKHLNMLQLCILLFNFTPRKNLS